MLNKLNKLNKSITTQIINQAVKELQMEPRYITDEDTGFSYLANYEDLQMTPELDLRIKLDLLDLNEHLYLIPEEL